MNGNLNLTSLGSGRRGDDLRSPLDSKPLQRSHLGQRLEEHECCIRERVVDLDGSEFDADVDHRRGRQP